MEQVSEPSQISPPGSIHWVHGFLGKSSDFSTLLSPEIQRYTSVFYDLFSPYSDAPVDLKSLGKWINEKAKLHPAPRVFVGYSLGGRIGLQALLNRPEIWSKAVIISAHPGLLQREEREARLKVDQAWADRFSNDRWENVVEDWNSQPVLQGTQLERIEGEFSKELLSEIMIHSSLGTQQDLRSELKSLNVPILWISGDRDAKFRALTLECAALNPKFQSIILDHAGHRAPWDQPQVFLQVILDFLEAKSDGKLDHNSKI